MGFLITASVVFFILLIISYLWDGYWNWVIDSTTKRMGQPWVGFFNFLGYSLLICVSGFIALALPYLWVVVLIGFVVAVMNGFAKNIAARIRILLGKIER